jgi:hypothetical protein
MGEEIGMKDLKINEIFLKDITRKINGVVKADQNEEEIVITELSEYVVTGELRKHFQKFFDRYVNSLNFPTEDMGVWISGFYGSGKSHFLKMIGRILENREYNGKRVTDFFKEKIEDAILIGNIEKASQTPTDVILFNVDNVSDQDTYQNKDSIAVAFMKNFNGYFGFSKDNLKIAEFERQLWEDGKLEEFKELFEEYTGKTWKDGKRNIDFYDEDFIEVVEELDIMSSEGANRWLERDDKISVSPETFADTLEHYLKLKGDKHRIVFLVDEIGQYIGDNSQLMLNLQTLVEVLGVRFQGRVWVGVTSQQDLGTILVGGEHRRNDFSKIQDRFKTMLSLSSGNIDEVIKKRLLEKKDVDKEELEKLYEENRINISNIISFDKGGMTLPLYKDCEDFSQTYPFVGYQFSLLQKVFEKVREMGFSGQHMSRGERSLLSSFQEAGIKVKDKAVGTLVPFNYFFESIEQFLEDVAKRPFILAKNERGVDDFELEVLKLLFLLKGIKGVESSINNLVSLMIDSVDCDRINLETKIKKALTKLEREVLIQKDGESYHFLTNEEQDINKEINQEQVDLNEVLKQVDSYIFNDIFTKNSVISDETGERYTFNRLIDEYNTSKKGEALDIHIFTPRCDNYENILMVASRGPEYELIIKLPLEIEDTLNEIKKYLQVDSYIKRKNLENTRDSIGQILLQRQKENQNRRRRIINGLEEALLNSDIFINGQKIAVGKANSGEKVIELALKEGIRYRFKLNALLKQPYDEIKIKSLLSYSYDNNMSFFELNKNLENNQNREAIKEVKFKIDTDVRKGLVTTLKDLIDYFAKAPYGWGAFSVKGLIAELWLLKLIDLEESKIRVNDSEKVKELLNKSQTRNLERVVIVVREEIDRELIKKVNNILKKYLGINAEISYDSPKEDLIKLLESKKQKAKSDLKICEDNAYPGEKQLVAWIELLDEILELKEKKADKFLKEFLDFEDEFGDLYEQQSAFEEFLNGSKREKFDSVKREIAEIENNLGYFGNLKETSSYKYLLEIVQDRKTFSRIREIDGFKNDLDLRRNEVVENEKIVLISKAKKNQRNFEEILKNREALLERVKTKLEAYIERVEKIDKIERVMSEARELENIVNDVYSSYRKYIKEEVDSIKSEVLKTLQDKADSEELEREIEKSYNSLKAEVESRDITELEEIIVIADKDREQFIAQASGKAKRKERIQLDRIKVVQKYNIENEEEANKYIEELEKEIEELKAKMLKAINENKIVDIR